MPQTTVGVTVAPYMLHALARNWWLLLLRGIFGVLFGVFSIVWPGMSLLTLVLIYGIYALADGVVSIAAAIQGGTAAPRWWLTVVGLLGIAAGVLTYLWPGITAVVLVMLIGIWAIATGVMQIMGAIKLRKEIEGEWLLIASGALSVIVGAFLCIWPGAGALALATVIGVYAIFYGALLIGFALRLRRHRHARA